MKEFKPIQVLTLVFPEKAISLEQLGYEQYAMNMEIFQGLMHEASTLNGRVLFQHMPETDNQILLDQQTCQLKDSGGVIMIGKQLQPLRERLQAANIPVLTIFSYQEMVTEQKTEFGRSLARTVDKISSYLHKAAYRRLVLIGHSGEGMGSGLQEKIQIHEQKLKIDAFRNRGFNIEGVFNWGAGELSDLMRYRVEDRIFFPLHTRNVSDIFRFAYREGLRIGRDFDLLALASGFSFANYFPPVSYFRVPYFEQGRAAARMLLEGTSDFLPDPVYIQGETSRKMEE
jgi:DNA-binding LacI/PurR family transcriptional regulator